MNYKILVSAILSAIILCSASLYSAEPLVKFYFIDGTTKQYNLSEIDSLGVIDKKNNYVMRIHYSDSLIAYYPTEIIGSIKFENDSLNVYIFSYPKPYKISSIDSLIFYIDQWQPLTIGSQVWMLKNLDVNNFRNGVAIPFVPNNSTWMYLKTSAQCFYNNDSTKGKLYNWYAVNDSNILSPKGWHVPSDSEWTELQNYLGTWEFACGLLKEADTTHWKSPNTGATNESGFTALPCGCRAYKGIFDGYGSQCWLWTSSEDTTKNSVTGRYLGFNTVRVIGSFVDKAVGYSVRCVKDKP